MQFRSVIEISICAALLSACTAATTDARDAVTQGQIVYAKECSQCHGAHGEGAGSAPDLIGLRQRNDGYFPREFVRRFVMGLLEKEDPNSTMPDFASVGLRHVYPNGGADGNVLEADFENLLDYLAAIQD
ncbi:MAG: c-type cytochrome [Sulfitobacter sp.]